MSYQVPAGSELGEEGDQGGGEGGLPLDGHGDCRHDGHGEGNFYGFN